MKIMCRIVSFSLFNFICCQAFGYSLTLIGSVTNLDGGGSARATSVDVVGNNAFVSMSIASAPGLRVVNITTPTSPALLGSLVTSDAKQVKAIGNYAYLADHYSSTSGALRVIDATNPVSPSQVGSLSAANEAFGVDVADNKAYVANWGNWMVVNVTNPSAPIQVSSTSLSSVRNIAVSGDYAYVITAHSSLKIYNISNSTSPSLVGSYDGLQGGDAFVVVVGNYAYVADGSGGLKIINVANPVSPTLIGSLSTTDAWGVDVSGDYAYVADGAGGLKMVDISDPTSPTLLTSLAFSGTAYSVKVVNNYIYVTEGNNLRIVQVEGLAPSLTSFSKSCYKNGSITFISDDFSNNLSSYSGGSLTKIKVVNLPSHGTLKLSGASIVPNQEITAGNLQYLVYAPDGEYTGADSFTWNGFDGTSYAGSDASVNITVDPSSLVVTNISKAVCEDTALSLTSSDFTTHFSGGSLVEVKIVSLPTHGALNLSGAAVSVNQVIPVASLGNLTYTPTVGYVGTDSFVWNGSDGANYADNSASVILTISDQAVVSDLTKTGHLTINFVASDFTSSFSNCVGGSLVKIKIVSLPSNGILELSGSQVGLNQEILINNLGNLKYIPNSGYSGTDNFTWNGSDGTNYAVSAASVNITIQNRAPIVLVPISKQQGKVGETFSFTVPSDTFNDPDGDKLSFSAYLSSYASLPGWLSFDKASMQFSGTPVVEGVNNLKVIAADSFGGEAQADFALEILKGESGVAGDYCNNNPGVCYVLPSVVTIAIAAAGGAFGLYKYMHESKKVTTASVPMTSPALP